MEKKLVIKQAIQMLEQQRKNLQEMDLLGVLLENELIHKSNQISSMQILLSKLIPLEEEQIKQAYGDGLNAHRTDFCNRDEYFVKTFGDVV
jgi:predicted transposase YdaD